MGIGDVAAVVRVVRPASEPEDALDKRICEGQICAEDGCVGFAEIPLCPFRAERSSIC